MRTTPQQTALLAPACLLALALVLSGCSGTSASRPDGAQPVGAPAAFLSDSLGIYVAQSRPAPGLAALAVPGGVVYAQRVPLLTRADLTDAAAMADGHGQNFVGLRFTEAGTRKLASASASNIGRMLAFMVDRRVVALPSITGPLDRGVLAFGVSSRQAALAIAARIRGESPPLRQ